MAGSGGKTTSTTIWILSALRHTARMRRCSRDANYEGSRRSEVASCATAIGRIRFHICCIRSGSTASKTLLVTNEQRCPYNARAKRTDLDTVAGRFNAQRFAKPDDRTLAQYAVQPASRFSPATDSVLMMWCPRDKALALVLHPLIQWNHQLPLTLSRGCWREPDEGIWEVRGPRRHFTHSKVMAWVAFDRALKWVEKLGVASPIDRWRQVRDAIHADVCRNGFDSELDSFVQAYGSKVLDASLLLLSIVGFLPPSDPRILGTVRAVERRLLVDDLVFRYDTRETDDGLPPGEGAFLACSFWFVDNLILQGRIAEAQSMFEWLLALRNDVGLLAEEYDPRTRRQLGNFPQAFSHVSLANTAYNLTRYKGPSEIRADRKVAEA